MKLRDIIFAVIIVALIILPFFVSDSHETDDYEIGYDAGYSDARSKYEDDYSRGYDDGYSEGYCMGSSDLFHECELTDTVYKAYEYARDNTSWSVYEAWNNILIYHDGYDPYGYDLPTEAEYLQSIETLVYFCEYLDKLGIN